MSEFKENNVIETSVADKSTLKVERVRYDLMLKLSDIELVDKYNESRECPPSEFYDPLYTVVLKQYFNLLGLKEANTLVISEPEFFKKTFELNKERKDEFCSLYCVKEPYNMICHAINFVCAHIVFLGCEKLREEQLEESKKEDQLINSQTETVDKEYDLWVEAQEEAMEKCVMKMNAANTVILIGYFFECICFLAISFINKCDYTLFFIGFMLSIIGIAGHYIYFIKYRMIKDHASPLY